MLGVWSCNFRGEATKTMTRCTRYIRSEPSTNDNPYYYNRKPLAHLQLARPVEHEAAGVEGVSLVLKL